MMRISSKLIYLWQSISISRKFKSINFFINKQLMKKIQSYKQFLNYKLYHQYTNSLPIWLFSIALISLINMQVQCLVTESQQQQQQNKQQSQISVIQLDKVQLIDLLQNNNEKVLLIIYSKFQKLNIDKFQSHFQNIINQLKHTQIKKFYLIQRIQIQHLNHYIKKLNNGKILQFQNKNSQEYYYYLINSSFNKKSFQINANNISNEINTICKLEVIINPNKQQFQQSQSTNCRTTVVKQCMRIGDNCEYSYKQNIKELIDNGLFQGYQNSYRFYLITKDKASQYEIEEQNIGQQTYVFRNDILGKQLVCARNWHKQYGHKVNKEESLMMMIRPRVHILSQNNYKTDLQWLLTTLIKNQSNAISVSKLLSGYQSHGQIDILKLLKHQYPFLELVILNTSAVSQIIRHAYCSQWTIFKLNGQIPYPKKFLPFYNPKLSAVENYHRFRPQIDKFITEVSCEPIVIPIHERINTKQLLSLIQANQSNVLIRVCQKYCIPQPIPSNYKVYEIDAEIHNIDLQKGTYCIKDRKLQYLPQFSDYE